MNEEFEKPGEPIREVTPEIETSAPEFKKALTEKISETLKHLLDAHVEKYFDDHVKKEDLDAAVKELFSSLQNGKPRREILDDLNRLAAEIAEDSLK